MKIKTDFVTNSSSVSFVISFESEMNIDNFSLNFTREDDEELRSFLNKEELIEYCQDNECDWVNLITGPTDFMNMSKRQYEELFEIMSNGEYVIYADMENNDWERVEQFQREVEENGGTIISSEPG